MPRGAKWRPLKLGFYGTAVTRSAAMGEFLERKLLPAAAALLGRSIRVRMHAYDRASAVVSGRILSLIIYRDRCLEQRKAAA